MHQSTWLRVLMILPQMLLKGLEQAEDKRRDTVHETEVLLLQSVY